MLSGMPEVAELHPVPDAHVPVMKFKFKGVSIDLLYAKLSLRVIPEVSIYHDTRLQKYIFSPSLLSHFSFFPFSFCHKIFCTLY